MFHVKHLERKIMKITLYNNLSDALYVSKQLVKVAEVDCIVKEMKDVLTPSFSITADAVPEWLNANYAYVDTFNRYYFAKLSVDTAGRLAVECNVDPLTSNKREIRMVNCVILRQEYNYSPYFQDAELAKRVNRKFIYRQIGTLPAAATNYLTVDGGKQDGNS